MLKYLAALSFALLSGASALAASDDAWAEFAREVEEACRAATSSILTNAQAVVDPFGSESYGLTILTGDAAPGVTKSIVCVFNKQTKAVEIGGELDLSATPVTPQ